MRPHALATRCAAALLLVIAAHTCVLVPRSHAATIFVPPVTITAFEHRGFPPTSASDFIRIPGTGYTNSGFTATIATGDVVVVRIQAPPGKMFFVNGPSDGSLGNFSFNFYWQSGPDIGSGLHANTVTYEHFAGVPPIEVYSLVLIGEARNVVEVWKQYTFRGPFQFSAIEFRITARTGPTTTGTFAPVASYQDPAFIIGANTFDPVRPIVEIVDLGPVPTRTTSWGRIKNLYR